LVGGIDKKKKTFALVVRKKRGRKMEELLSA